MSGIASEVLIIFLLLVANGVFARLCGFLPEGASLVIASREDIPFPAARLRASAPCDRW